jgi:hypothetical protein
MGLRSRVLLIRDGALQGAGLDMGATRRNEGRKDANFLSLKAVSKHKQKPEGDRRRQKE